MTPSASHSPRTRFVRITPDLKRIMQQDYVDKDGFWRVVPVNDSAISRFNFRRAIGHVFDLILWMLPLAAFFAVFWFTVVTIAKIPEILTMRKVIAWIASLGIFAPALIARVWDGLSQWRRGPYILIDTLHHTIALPQRGVQIPTNRILWSVLHSVHNFGSDGKSRVTELMLILLPEDGERTCLSISRGYGRKGLCEIDRKARLLASATNAELTCSGYPPDFSPVPVR